MSRFQLSAQRGFSLLEVLITVLVLAIGLLGLAALQLSSANATQEGYMRAQATALADAVSSRMLANADFVGADPDNLLNGAADSGNYERWCRYGSAPIAFAQACPVGGGCACTGAECTSAERIVFDKRQICEAGLQRRSLPDGEIGITCWDNSSVVDGDACSPGSRYTLYVAWTPAVRTDTTGGEGLSNDNFCHQPVSSGGMGLAATKTCVMLEMVL